MNYKDLFFRILTLGIWVAIAAGYGLQGYHGQTRGPSPAWVNYALAAGVITIGLITVVPPLSASRIFKIFATALLLGLLGAVQYFEQHDILVIVIIAPFVVYAIWWLPNKKGRFSPRVPPES